LASFAREKIIAEHAEIDAEDLSIRTGFLGPRQFAFPADPTGLVPVVNQIEAV